jgi:molybdopterin molybdotransferase
MGDLKLADLLHVDRALELVLEQFQPLESERIELSESLGRVLAEDIFAETNIPPFANSSMDGFAVRSADTVKASRDAPQRLKLVMDIAAGSSPSHAIGEGEAARIMTGAPMPEGADAVIPVENTDGQWTPGDNAVLSESVTIYRSLERGAYVRPAGEDLQIGQRVVGKGSMIRAQEIGVLASIGCQWVTVTRQPRVAIVSTGDELIEIHEPLVPGKIRDSNSYTLAALVSTFGAIPIRIPTARDNLDDVRRRFLEAIDHKPDVILSSAGVSVGAFDVVRAILDELGQINFWRINLRPGKPLAFGHLRGIPFFGLPGNPVSATVTFDVFVRPALLKLGNQPDHSETIAAVLDEVLHSDGRRSYLRVKLERQGEQWIARLTGTQSSGALMSMVLADGLLVVPEDITVLTAGSAVTVRLLRKLSINNR